MSRSLVYRLSVVVVRITFKEHLVDVLGVLFGYIQPFSLAGCPVVSDGSFVHVSHIIEFVTMYHERIRLVAGSPTVLVLERSRKPFIQISVRTLGVCYDINDFVHLLFQFGIFLQSQQIGHAFHYLEQVRCHIARKIFQFSFACFQVFAHPSKVLDSRFRLFECKWSQCLFLGFQTREPELVLKCHLFEGDRGQGLLFLYDRFLTRQ